LKIQEKGIEMKKVRFNQEIIILGCNSVVKHLPSMLKALGLIPQHPKPKSERINFLDKAYSIKNQSYIWNDTFESDYKKFKVNFRDLNRRI
jgi:hypothetical protein